jgi:DNA polymerase-4
MGTTATILHADLDAFYASVEQLLDPSLRGKPIAVGGGVVLAASYEAKAFGVRGGMPGRQARELCPQLTFVNGHFKDYRRLGDAAIKVVDDFTPLVERISIDEAFADVTGCTHLFGPPAEIASAIRHRVRAELGLPISIGVARTKHLAKIASQVAKPDGLVVVDPDTELEFLHHLPVGLMWGVGPVTKARLAEIGVFTIGQLAKTPGWSLERLLGPAAGEKLAALAWESRSTGNQDSPTDRIGRSTVGGRQEACRRASIPTYPAASCRQNLHPPPSQVQTWSNRDGPRSLRQHGLSHSLGNARRANLRNRGPCRDSRGAGARGPRGSPGREEHLAPSDLRVASR